ncbi:unnamed protein product [Schistosoma rodhaini]|nr:unnamed protein product [Schistosoma rodhaini]
MTACCRCGRIVLQTFPVDPHSNISAVVCEKLVYSENRYSTPSSQKTHDSIIHSQCSSNQDRPSGPTSLSNLSRNVDARKSETVGRSVNAVLHWINQTGSNSVLNAMNRSITEVITGLFVDMGEYGSASSLQDVTHRICRWEPSLCSPIYNTPYLSSSGERDSARSACSPMPTNVAVAESVSLLAYPSPTSKDCPLRGLLDPVWRDTIASVINSAVLKAHDLPAQPALEHGLRALQRCFQDKNFVEAQTLGHFLLYHLTPAQIAKADEEVAALEASIEHQGVKRLRSSPSQSNSDQINDPDDNTSSGSHSNEINGHNAIRRRARRRRRRRVDGTVSESQSSEHTDECNSSVEEVNKEDDEEEEEDEEGRCNSEDDDDDFDNDDDEEDGSSAVPSRRPNTRSSQTTSVGAQSDSGFSESRGSNGGSSGRNHSACSSNTASLTPTGTVAPNIRLGRQTDLTRYLPSFLYSNHARLITSVSSSPVPNLHRSSAPSRRFTTLTTSARIDSNHSRRCETVDSHFDSAFRGLLSMSYPHRAEFLAAMDDALKAYAGPLLLTEDEQIVASNPQHEYLQRDPPSPTGGGSCT